MTISPPPSRPVRGMAHYLRDVVNGALDGVITTLAVVSATDGAALAPRVALVLGLANLAADGLSMGASNYLGLKSELEQAGLPLDREQPWRHGLATAAAFVTVGAVPLLAFAIPTAPGTSVLPLAVALAVLALGVAGSVKGRLLKKRAWRSAAEMIILGLAASAAAYLVGLAARSLLG